MSKKLLYAGLLLTAFLTTSCGDPNAVCENAPTTVSLSVSQSALENITLTGDEPAANAIARINDVFASGRTLRMNIYELNSPDSIDDLIAKRHFAAPQNIEDSKAVVIQDGDILCAWNRNSLYEQCINEPIFNSNTGVMRSELHPDSFYISKALNILNEELTPRTSAHYAFLPYKRKYGINATAPIHEPENVTETVYEVAVGFASELDGWPVIGPGGKAYIHLLPDGTCAAQKIYRKLPGNVVATLTENDLKTPEEALNEIIQKENIDMNDYRIVRQEFGYLFLGKNSIQNIIAPHYAFFFAPTNSRFDTQIYHIVSAVKGEAAQIVDNDYQLELDRKANKIKDIAPAQEK